VPLVTGHWPTKVWVTGSNSPIMELSGVVNQTLPAPSRATKIGWLPVTVGSFQNWAEPEPARRSPIWPGAADAEQVGAKSHPGSANQTFPRESMAVPHGSPTPVGLNQYSVMVVGGALGDGPGLDVGLGLGLGLGDGEGLGLGGGVPRAQAPASPVLANAKHL
jgi:hypothetical protein